MTRPHDDPTPVEDDPTGMRALLAALPDPGPMPEDLVARITAALAEESRAAARTPLVDAGTVVALHPRRGAWRHLGVAAAVVTAIGLGGLAFGAWPGTVTASMEALSGASGSDESMPEAAASGDEAAAPARGGADLSDSASPEEAADVVVIMSGRNHGSATLYESAPTLTAAATASVTPLTAESPGIGPIATPIGARSCADALGVPTTAGILVDVSTVDGAPAAVLVVDEAGVRTAYAVGRSCTTGSPALIIGPVSLP